MRLTFAIELVLASSAAASSKLFTGGTIVAFDSPSESIRVIRDGALLVTDDRIAGVYESEPGSVPNGTERIDVTSQILTPGFIDTHRHGWQTAFKTLGSNTTLLEYVDRYGEYAAAPYYTAEDVYVGQLAGLYEALNAGVTTTLDHAHHTWSPDTAIAGLNASVDSGARVFWAYAFHELPSSNFTLAAQFANFRDIAESDLTGDSPASLAIAFDAWLPGAADPSAVQQVVDLALQYNVSALTTHTVLGPYGWANTPTNVHAHGLLNISIPHVFSHGSFLPAGDATLLRQTNQHISITPESEMHYGHTHEESFYLLDQASIGVDTHFTFSTDILTQARIWLQTVRYRFFNAVAQQWLVPARNPMSVAQAFKLATRSGGLALHRPDLGVIEEGAKADIVVWNANESPALLGWSDPVAAVMLHASVGDILHVLVDGEFVKKDGKLVAPGYADLRERFLASAKRIQDAWREVPYKQYEGPSSSGYDFANPRQADVQRGEGTGDDALFL